MSQLKILQYFKSIEEKEFLILKSIEKLMSSHLNVKLEDIAKFANFNYSYILKKIDKFNKIGLIETKRSDDQYIGVRLKFMGYDALALNDLVENHNLNAVGSPIGIGKESNVFNGILENGTECVIKFHKLGKTKFRATKRKRNFIAEKNHISRLYESAINAKREAKALNELAGLIPVPRLYGYSRHVIVMQKIEGIDLNKANFLSEEELFLLYTEIMNYIKIMVKSNFIHGDLSVFNIILENSEGKPSIYIIDWPQYLRLDHPNSLSNLLSDLNNIYTYFNKKTIVEPMNIEEFGINLLNDTKNRLRIRN